MQRRRYSGNHAGGLAVNAADTFAHKRSKQQESVPSGLLNSLVTGWGRERINKPAYQIALCRIRSECKQFEAASHWAVGISLPKHTKQTDKHLIKRKSFNSTSDIHKARPRRLLRTVGHQKQRMLSILFSHKLLKRKRIRGRVWRKNAAVQGNKQAPLTKHETPGHTQPEANAAHVTGETKTKTKKKGFSSGGIQTELK